MSKIVSFIDSFLDKHFANDYQVKVRCGDLIEYHGEQLCILNILSDNQFECQSCGKKDIKIRKLYYFPELVPYKIFKWWVYWKVIEPTEHITHIKLNQQR